VRNMSSVWRPLKLKIISSSSPTRSRDYVSEVVQEHQLAENDVVGGLERHAIGGRVIMTESRMNSETLE